MKELRRVPLRPLWNKSRGVLLGEGIESMPQNIPESLIVCMPAP